MVSKEDALHMLRFAAEYEERFLPELKTLMDEKILTFRLAPEKQQRALIILDILTKESKNHRQLLIEQYEKTKKSDKNDY
jgi:hypothetical protein